MLDLITLVMLSLHASGASPWPNTEMVVKEVCEIRIPAGNKLVTYGANEYVKSRKNGGFEICRQKLVLRSNT
jgi:hypothetical protein